MTFKEYLKETRNMNLRGRVKYGFNQLFHPSYRKMAYWRMRARVYLLKPVLNWGWLRRRLKDDHHKINLRPEHRKYLKEYMFRCSICTPGAPSTTETAKYPLGDCNLIPISENPQGVRTALVTCPVCSCISFEGRVFDFNRGRMKY